jgi:hypothetical protein
VDYAAQEKKGVFGQASPAQTPQSSHQLRKFKINEGDPDLPRDTADGKFPVKIHYLI